MGKMMMAAGMAALLMSGAAYAQSTAPTTSGASATPAAAAPAMDKTAKSKACSAEADKQGLHGKARKTFRSKCKAGKA